MKRIKLNPKNKSETVKAAVKTLTAGGLVIYPTETCYGIGALATDQKAVNKLLKYKARREGKPLSIAVADEKMAKKYVVMNQTAQNLYNNYLPGPMTVISRGKHKLAQGVEAENGTLGIRIPDYGLILEIIRNLNKPITATSANASYKKRPYAIADIWANISEKQKRLIDLIIDAGKLAPNPPSTVVDTTMDDYMILRRGKLKPDSNGGKKLISKSEKETKNLAKSLMLKELDFLQKGCLILALEGDLGTGKTVFAKGAAEFLKIERDIVSPTFVIVREYNYKRYSLSGKMIHIDVWRLFSPNEFDSLNIQTYFKPGNVIIIEWAEKVNHWLKKINSRTETRIIGLKLEHKDENERKIKVREWD